MAPHGNVHVVKSRSDWENKLFEANTNGKAVVVDFTASWCGPCKFMAPIFAELSEMYPHVMFLKVDVDELNDISQQYEIRAMPTFLFMLDGEQPERLVGANKVELGIKVGLYAHKSAVTA